LLECTTSLAVQVDTAPAKRGEVASGTCELVDYYFLVEGSGAPLTSFSIHFSYDPGCDGCGGYTDGCGCHASDTYSECACEQASYRGYDSLGLDRSLLVRPCAARVCACAVT